MTAFISIIIHCISIDYTLESNLSAVLNENTSLIIPCKYRMIFHYVKYFTKYFIATTTGITSLVQTVGSLSVTLSQVPPTLTLSPSRSGPSLVSTFTSLSVTTNQATPISNLVTITNESSLVGMLKIVPFVWCYSGMCFCIGSSIAAIALSSVIALVVVLFVAIFIGLFYYKRKR